MKFREWMSIYGPYAISPVILRDGEYLERHGYTFLIDFGYENATQKAKELFQKLL